MKVEAEPGAAPPVVVYIAGSGRSGSTLLERLLGAVPGAVNVGELVDLPRTVSTADERCGCGRPFSLCPFWSEVGDRAFGGWDAEVLHEMASLQEQVGRQRQLPGILAGRWAGGGFRDGLARYAHLYAELYRAIAGVAGADVVVDASKRVAQGAAVASRGETDLRLVHLVRDARGVAFSWAKRDVARPQGGRSLMSSRSPASTALRWAALQTEISVTRRSLPRSTVVRYEDLVSAPRSSVTTLLAELGIVVADQELDHIGERHASLPPSHGLSGNPSRFATGEVSLRRDEQWRTDMPARQVAATTALAALPLAVHHYIGTRR